MKYGYAQVSATDQNADQQLKALRKAGGHKLFTDHEIAVNAELNCHFFADADVPRLTNSLFLAPDTLLIVPGKLRSAFPG
jgi:hypothetical protein